MIKGINRQVIEVTETGNPYFERALLVVRPSYRDDDESGCVRRPADGSRGVRLQRHAARPAAAAAQPDSSVAWFCGRRPG